MIDKGPGVVVHPARGHREDTLSQLLAPLLAGGEAGARRDRAPPRPRHLRAARGGAHRGGPPARCRRRSPSGGSSASTWRSSRAARRRARARSRRRSAATRACARAWPSAAPARARRAPTSRSSARCASTSLLRLRLDTGRTHQIRVHLQAIGHPGVRRPRVRHGRAARARAPVPARHAPGLRASRQRRADRARARRCPRTCRRALERAEQAILSDCPKPSPRPVRQRIAALPGATRPIARLRVRVHPRGHTTRSHKGSSPWPR